MPSASHPLRSPHASSTCLFNRSGHLFFSRFSLVPHPIRPVRSAHCLRSASQIYRLPVGLRRATPSTPLAQRRPLFPSVSQVFVHTTPHAFNISPWLMRDCPLSARTPLLPVSHWCNSGRQEARRRQSVRLFLDVAASVSNAWYA